MRADKQVYYERQWIRCELMSQKGTSISVRMNDGNTVTVPFQHVRDVCPVCPECGCTIWHSSYQAHSGDSYCVRCYKEMSPQVIDLLFGGYQWISWDGQMSIREMDDDHLINTLGRLRRNADEAAELAGGRPEEYLSPHFPHLVDELRRRRPEDVGSIKMNSMLLYIWTVLILVLSRAGLTAQAEEHKKVEKKKKKKKKTTTKPVARRSRQKEKPITPEEMQVPW